MPPKRYSKDLDETELPSTKKRRPKLARRRIKEFEDRQGRLSQIEFTKKIDDIKREIEEFIEGFEEYIKQDLVKINIDHENQKIDIKYDEPLLDIAQRIKKKIDDLEKLSKLGLLNPQQEAERSAEIKILNDNLASLPDPYKEAVQEAQTLMEEIRTNIRKQKTLPAEISLLKSEIHEAEETYSKTLNDELTQKQDELEILYEEIGNFNQLTEYTEKRKVYEEKVRDLKNVLFNIDPEDFRIQDHELMPGEKGEKLLMAQLSKARAAEKELEEYIKELSEMDDDLRRMAENLEIPSNNLKKLFGETSRDWENLYQELLKSSEITQLSNEIEALTNETLLDKISTLKSEASSTNRKISNIITNLESKSVEHSNREISILESRLEELDQKIKNLNGRVQIKDTTAKDFSTSNFGSQSEELQSIIAEINKINKEFTELNEIYEGKESIPFNLFFVERRISAIKEHSANLAKKIVQCHTLSLLRMEEVSISSNIKEAKEKFLQEINAIKTLPPSEEPISEIGPKKLEQLFELPDTKIKKIKEDLQRHIGDLEKERLILESKIQELKIKLEDVRNEAYEDFRPTVETELKDAIDCLTSELRELDKLIRTAKNYPVLSPRFDNEREKHIQEKITRLKRSAPKKTSALKMSLESKTSIFSFNSPDSPINPNDETLATQEEEEFSETFLPELMHKIDVQYSDAGEKTGDAIKNIAELEKLIGILDSEDRTSDRETLESLHRELFPLSEEAREILRTIDAKKIKTNKPCIERRKGALERKNKTDKLNRELLEQEEGIDKLLESLDALEKEKPSIQKVKDLKAWEQKKEALISIAEDHLKNIRDLEREHISFETTNIGWFEATIEKNRKKLQTLDRSISKTLKQLGMLEPPEIDPSLKLFREITADLRNLKGDAHHHEIFKANGRILNNRGQDFDASGNDIDFQKRFKDWTDNKERFLHTADEKIKGYDDLTEKVAEFKRELGGHHELELQQIEKIILADKGELKPTRSTLDDLEEKIKNERVTFIKSKFEALKKSLEDLEKESEKEKSLEILDGDSPKSIKNFVLPLYDHKGKIAEWRAKQKSIKDDLESQTKAIDDLLEKIVEHENHHPEKYTTDLVRFKKRIEARKEALARKIERTSALTEAIDDRGNFIKGLLDKKAGFLRKSDDMSTFPTFYSSKSSKLEEDFRNIKDRRSADAWLRKREGLVEDGEEYLRNIIELTAEIKSIANLTTFKAIANKISLGAPDSPAEEYTNKFGLELNAIIEKLEEKGRQVQSQLDELKQERDLSFVEKFENLSEVIQGLNEIKPKTDISALRKSIDEDAHDENSYKNSLVKWTERRQAILDSITPSIFSLTKLQEELSQFKSTDTEGRYTSEIEEFELSVGTRLDLLRSQKEGTEKLNIEDRKIESEAFIEERNALSKEAQTALELNIDEYTKKAEDLRSRLEKIDTKKTSDQWNLEQKALVEKGQEDLSALNDLIRKITIFGEDVPERFTISVPELEKLLELKNKLDKQVILTLGPSELDEELLQELDFLRLNIIGIEAIEVPDVAKIGDEIETTLLNPKNYEQKIIAWKKTQRLTEEDISQKLETLKEHLRSINEFTTADTKNRYESQTRRLKFNVELKITTLEIAGEKTLKLTKPIEERKKQAEKLLEQKKEFDQKTTTTISKADFDGYSKLIDKIALEFKTLDSEDIIEDWKLRRDELKQTGSEKLEIIRSLKEEIRGFDSTIPKQLFNISMEDTLKRLTDLESQFTEKMDEMELDSKLDMNLVKSLDDVRSFTKGIYSTIPFDINELEKHIRNDQLKPETYDGIIKGWENKKENALEYFKGKIGDLQDYLDITVADFEKTKGAERYSEQLKTLKSSITSRIEELTSLRDKALGLDSPIAKRKLESEELIERRNILSTEAQTALKLDIDEYTKKVGDLKSRLEKIDRKDALEVWNLDQKALVEEGREKLRALEDLMEKIKTFHNELPERFITSVPELNGLESLKDKIDEQVQLALGPSELDEELLQELDSLRLNIIGIEAIEVPALAKAKTIISTTSLDPNNYNRIIGDWEKTQRLTDKYITEKLKILREHLRKLNEFANSDTENRYKSQIEALKLKVDLKISALERAQKKAPELTALIEERRGESEELIEIRNRLAEDAQTKLKTQENISGYEKELTKLNLEFDAIKTAQDRKTWEENKNALLSKVREDIEALEDLAGEIEKFHQSLPSQKFNATVDELEDLRALAAKLQNKIVTNVKTEAPELEILQAIDKLRSDTLGVEGIIIPKVNELKTEVETTALDPKYAEVIEDWKNRQDTQLKSINHSIETLEDYIRRLDTFISQFDEKSEDKLKIEAQSIRTKVKLKLDALETAKSTVEVIPGLITKREKEAEAYILRKRQLAEEIPKIKEEVLEYKDDVEELIRKSEAGKISNEDLAKKWRASQLQLIERGKILDEKTNDLDEKVRTLKLGIESNPHFEMPLEDLKGELSTIIEMFKQSYSDANDSKLEEPKLIKEIESDLENANAILREIGVTKIGGLRIDHDALEEEIRKFETDVKNEITTIDEISKETLVGFRKKLETLEEKRKEILSDLDLEEKKLLTITKKIDALKESYPEMYHNKIEEFNLAAEYIKIEILNKKQKLELLNSEILNLEKRLAVLENLAPLEEEEIFIVDEEEEIEEEPEIERHKPAEPPKAKPPAEEKMEEEEIIPATHVKGKFFGAVAGLSILGIITPLIALIPFPASVIVFGVVALGIVGVSTFIGHQSDKATAAGEVAKERAYREKQKKKQPKKSDEDKVIERLKKQAPLKPKPRPKSARLPSPRGRKKKDTERRRLSSRF